MSLFSKKTAPRTAYDPGKMIPALQCSICTSEKRAGFREIATGKFREVMLIRSPDDLETFRRQYGIDGEIETIY